MAKENNPICREYWIKKGYSTIEAKKKVTKIQEEDNAFEFEDGDKRLILVVDPKSYLLTNGTIIDYQKTLLDSKFVFNNPLATGGCDCGKSFSVD